MKKNTKIMVKILIIAITILLISTVVFADDLLNPENIKGTSTDASGSVTKVAGNVLGIVQVIAVAVAVIMLLVLGIKYISASPEGKADIKKSAMIYIVGAILLFGATGILQIIKAFAETIK